MKQIDRFFKLAQSQAGRTINDKDEMFTLADSAGVKAAKSGKLKELLSQIVTMGKMIKDVAGSKYRNYSKGSFTLIVAGMIYLVCPVDAIPDAIPVAGLLDDAIVLTFVLGKVSGELERYSSWKNVRK